MGSPFHLISFPQRAILGIVLLCSFCASSLFGDKVTQSVIVASIEGEVSSLNLIDDFKVNMSPAFVGKKISPKTILSTGKSGKVSLLFSNGTLITVKPGSRFYLRKYKQLEAVVENLPSPGKLEEEPTKSELSAHLDFGELIVKAPKLKKGSSMNLSSPIGTAGIRGTMFQFMAVRNPVSGDIMGGINLVSGDIDFTDTDGNKVTILSGQSIQLATSKLGESVASQTGELVDLSSTYGPALTQDGALPPPISSIFPNLNPGGESDDASSDAEDGATFDEPIVVGPSTGGLDFIQEIASEVFFAIEESEQASSDFSFESIQMAPPVEAPIPEVEPPSAPASVTGETTGGDNIDRFLGVAPTLSLRNQSDSNLPDEDTLFTISPDGYRVTTEFRSPDDGKKWSDLDPGVDAFDFLGSDIGNAVVVSGQPDIVLENPNDAPAVGASVLYNVVYEVTDFRNATSKITRQVEVFATRPSIKSIPALADRYPYTDPDNLFQDWIEQIQVTDVRGYDLNYSSAPANNSYYLSIDPTVTVANKNSLTDFQIIAQDWRGLTTVSDTLQVSVTAIPPSVDPTGEFISVELSGEPLSTISPNTIGLDEFDNNISQESITLISVTAPEGFPSVDPSDRIDSLADQTYTLTYQIEDSRGEVTNFQRSLKIFATAPSFVDLTGAKGNGIPFESNASWLSTGSLLEFTDPLNEIEGWIGSQNARDFNDNSVAVSSSILSFDSGTIPSFAPPYKDLDLPVGEYRIGFEAKDTRYIDAHPDWEDDLITEYNASLTIVATKPIIEITNGGWREGLTFDPEAGQIDYLVKPSSDYLTLDSDSDDGVFSLVAGEGNQSRAVYIKATAFDGTDISNLLSVNGININDNNGSSFEVDYNGQVGTETQLEVSVNDSSHRQISNGGESAATSFVVKLVDTLGPFLRIPEENVPFEIIGTRGKAFPVPRLEIIDNKYSQSEIESFQEVNQSSGSTLYPAGSNHFDYPAGSIHFDLGMPSNEADGILAFSGYYNGYVTFSGIKDLQGNVSRNEVELDVNVTDFTAPTVELISGSHYYVDLNQTTNYLPGVLVTENLFIHEQNETSIQLADGRVSIDLIDTLFNSDELYQETVKAFDKDNENTLIEVELNQSIETIIEEYNHTTDDYMYQVTYSFTDRAGNQANPVSRVFELVNDPNAPSVVTFNREDQNSSQIYTVEVTDNSAVITPGVSAFYSVSSGNIIVAVETEHYYQQNESDFTPITGAVSNEVNYYQDKNILTEYFVDSDGSQTEKTNGYPRHIVRYKASNQFGEEFTYDLEIRVQDTTAPTFELTLNTSLQLEGGYPYFDDFDDANATLSDNYPQNNPLTFTRSISKDDNNYTAPDSTDPFDDFETEGFWDVGEYTITYTANDSFDNTTTKTRTITVVDTIAPHMVLIPSSYADGQSITANSDAVSVNPTLIPINVGTVGGGNQPLDFDNEDPFIATANDFDLILKYSESNSSLFSSSEVNLELNATTEVSDDGGSGRQNITSHTESNTDDYGRTKLWYSAFALKENGAVYFRDPGVYIENNTSVSVTVYSKIHNITLSSATGELESFTVSYYSGSNSILSAREYTFLDETSPLITLSPTTSETLLIQIEAGDDITDNDNTTPPTLWDYEANTTDTTSSGISTYAYDARDGVLTSFITKRIYELGSSDGVSLPLETGYSKVNNRFYVSYDLNDSQGNAANSSRFYIVRDTTAPTIDASTNGSQIVIDYTSNYAANEGNTTAKILLDMSASDYNNIDVNLNPSSNYSKWNVQISKPDSDNDVDRSFMPGVVYPYVQGGDGYNVVITVTDEFGNESIEQNRTLVVEDDVAPTFVMIGESTIHDFFRYGGTNTSVGAEPSNQQLHTDRVGSPELNGTGFGSGAHRLFLADYDFTDPGIYAYDASFSSDEYPDFDGDGVPETHAMLKVSDFDSNSSLTPGIIYTKWSTELSSLSDIQSNLSGGGGNSPTHPIYIPDINATSSFTDENKTQGDSINVFTLTIDYRVKDGWGNIADESRTVYIYQSKQFGGSAFYATPLKTNTDANFTNLYDLSLKELDRDGDTYSDFWEIAFGTLPDDATSFPTDESGNPLLLSNKDFYTHHTDATFRANLDKIKNTPQYTTLTSVRNLAIFDINATP